MGVGHWGWAMSWFRRAGRRQWFAAGLVALLMIGGIFLLWPADSPGEAGRAERRPQPRRQRRSRQALPRHEAIRPLFLMRRPLRRRQRVMVCHVPAITGRSL